MPGVRLLKVTAVACGMLPLVKHIPPSEQATAEELDVADMVRRLGQILAARLDCDFTRRMVAGTPDNDLVAFLRVCAQLQLRPTLVEIRDGDDDTEDDAGDEGLPRRTWGDVIASTPDDETASPDVWLEESDLREKVAALLATLSPREERIVRMRFGIGDDRAREHTLEEIGQSLGLTRERIRQLEKRALVTLALRAWRNGLRPYLFPTIRACDAPKLPRPEGYLRAALEAEGTGAAPEIQIGKNEVAARERARAAEFVARERARAAEILARAWKKHADVKRFVAAEKAALQDYVASKNAARKAAEMEAAANAVVEDLIRNASATPGGPIDTYRIELEQGWALIKRADSESKLATAIAARKSYEAAQRATQEAAGIARVSELDVSEAIAAAERAQLEATKLIENERRAAGAADTTSPDFDDWMAELQTKLATKKAEREAQAAAKDAERLAKVAAEQAEREAREAAKQAEREARAAAVEAAKREAKAAAKRARREAKRAARKAKIRAEKARRKIELAATKDAERLAKATAKRAERAAREAAKQEAKAAARKARIQAELSELRIALERQAWAVAKQAEREAKAAAKQAEREAREEAKKTEREAAAMEAAKREAAKVATKQAEREAREAAKQAEREAKAAAKQAEREAREEAKQAEREARAAAKKAEREAREEAKKTEREARAAAAEAAKLQAKRAARKAKIQAEEAKRKSRLAAAKEAERQAKAQAERESREATKRAERDVKAKAESERRSLARAMREKDQAKRMSLTEFAQTAVVRRDAAVQLLKTHHLKKAASSDTRIDRRSAEKFIGRFVSVGEIRRFPHGKETEMLLNLAKVPPAVVLRKSGAVFYQRDYVMRVSAALC